MDAIATTPAPRPTPEQVFREHAPRVFNLARRMLGNDADAEDVTQDVLLQVVRKLGTFRGEANLGTWLHRVTVNAALAHRQKRSRREEYELHEPLELFQEDGHHAKPVRPWSVSPEAVLQNQEMADLVHQAIDRLPEPYRDVYVLADSEGLHNAEIADLLKIGVGAVKSRLHRARMMVRSALAPHFEEVA